MVAASGCCKVAQKNGDPAFFIRNIFAESVKGALSGLRQILATEGPLKIMKNANYEKCFLFQLKSSLCSLDIYVFVLTFWSCIKTG